MNELHKTIGPIKSGAGEPNPALPGAVEPMQLEHEMLQHVREDSMQGPPTDEEKGDTRAGTVGQEGSTQPIAKVQRALTPPHEAVVEGPQPPIESRRAKRASAKRAGALWDSSILAAAEKAEETAYLASVRHCSKSKKRSPSQEALYLDETAVGTASAIVAAPGKQVRESSRQRQRPRGYEDTMIDTDMVILDGDTPAAGSPGPDPAAAAVPSAKRSAASTRATHPAPKRQRANAISQGKKFQEDYLYGCGKCRYLKGGCGTCRSRPPTFTRPYARWNPSQGHHQVDIPSAPSFRPTLEEFQDPISYITKIMPEAMKYGLAHIIPPVGWDPPFALEKGTNGVSMESFKFATRKQLTSHLCYRSAPTKNPPGDRSTEAGTTEAAVAAGPRYGKKMTQTEATGQGEAGAGEGEAGLKDENTDTPAGAAAPALTPDDILAALAAVNGQAKVPAAAAPLSPPRPPPPQVEPDSDGASGAEEMGHCGEFGFVTLDKKHTLRSFAAYADWVKSVHFSDPPAKGLGASSAPSRRPSKTLPIHHTAPVDPSIEEIEAEFWRVVETPDSYLESLYGQDLDSGHHGSGFPLPEWRRRLLEGHLTTAARGRQGAGASEVKLAPPSTEAEKEYAEHEWNINNMPRCKSSMLRYLLGDGLITGVMVPWLYVGSCMSAFCWHVEDHALYSVNYLHMGCPKVWYGVPADATLALEEAMRDALPHLFDGNPGLLHQLVTTLSPMELKKRGVPVYRVLHEAGSFVITMPDAYHAGFNSGFNCAEAVNFAAPGWIPFGTDIAEKYRRANKPVTMSHDSLLVALATAAQHVAPTKLADNETKATPEAPGKQATGFGPLGDIPWADAPLQGIILGTGELALRAEEERQRWSAGLAALGVASLPYKRMDPCTSTPEAKDESGVHFDTAECDCAECAADLWLAAVVSPAAPGIAVCPEHAAVLVEKHGCPVETLYVLCRHTPEELQQLVDIAVERIEGAAEAVAEAQVRRAKLEEQRVHAVPVGPLYPTNEQGECISVEEQPAVDNAVEKAPVGKKARNTKKHEGKGRGKGKGHKWSEPHPSGGPPPLPGEKNRRGRPSKAELARREAAWAALQCKQPLLAVAVPAAPVGEEKLVLPNEPMQTESAPGEAEVKSELDMGPAAVVMTTKPVATNHSVISSTSIPVLLKMDAMDRQASPFSASVPPQSAAVDASRQHRPSPGAMDEQQQGQRQPSPASDQMPLLSPNQTASVSQVLLPTGLSSLLPPEPASQTFALQIAELAAAQHAPRESPQGKTELTALVASLQERKNDQSPLTLAPARSLDAELLMGQFSAAEEPIELAEARQGYATAAPQAVAQDGPIAAGYGIPVPMDADINVAADSQHVTDVLEAIPCATEAAVTAAAVEQQPAFDIGSLLA